MSTDPAPAWGHGIENQRRANLGDGTYRNPVMGGDYPDPTLLRVGETYYMTFSSFESSPALVLFRSTNLVDWEPVGPACPEPWGSVFATDLVEHAGRYYMYIPFMPTSWSRVDEPTIAVMWSDDIEGEWNGPFDTGLRGYIDPGHAVGHRLGQGDAGAGGPGDAAGRLDALLIGPQRPGRHNARIGAQERAVDEQRAARVEAGVADVGEGDLGGGPARVLQHGQGVAQHLGGVPLIGQAVPHGHAGQLGEGLHLGLGVAAVLDAVVPAAEHAGRVGGRLLVDELRPGRVEAGGVSALLRHGDVEGAAGAGGGFLEQQGDLLAHQPLDLASFPPLRLQLGGEVQDGQPLGRGEVGFLGEAASFEHHRAFLRGSPQGIATIQTRPPVSGFAHRL